MARKELTFDLIDPFDFEPFGNADVDRRSRAGTVDAEWLVEDWQEDFEVNLEREQDYGAPPDAADDDCNADRAFGPVDVPLRCYKAPEQQRAIQVVCIGDAAFHHWGVEFPGGMLDPATPDAFGFTDEPPFWLHPPAEGGMTVICRARVDGEIVFEDRVHNWDSQYLTIKKLYDSIVAAVASCDAEIERYQVEKARLSDWYFEKVRSLRVEPADVSDYDVDDPTEDLAFAHAFGLAFIRWAEEQGHRVLVMDFPQGERRRRPLAACLVFEWEEAPGCGCTPEEEFRALYHPEYCLTVDDHRKREREHREEMVRWELEANRPAETSPKKPGSVEDRVIAAIAEVLAERSVRAGDLSRITYLDDDLRIDAVEQSNLSMAIEDEFDIEVGDEIDLRRVRSIGDVVRLVERKLASEQ